jgi:hypothetical protein
VFRGLCLAVLLLLLAPVTAHAWTDAHVQTASAALRLSPEGALDVDLTVRVHVRGGWLEALEVAGLDPALVLADENVVAVSDEGERLTARASATEDGRVSIVFPRRAGPRRGHYTLVLRYRADLSARFAPSDPEHVLASWTFPGWQSGLDGVEVVLDAPSGARFVGEDDALVTLTRTREDVGDRTMLRWRRAHLPRTLAWELAFELPRRSVASHLGSAALPASEAASENPETARPLRSAARAEPTPLRPGVLLVGVLALLGALVFTAEARRRGARERFVVPMPIVLRASLVIAAVALAAFAFDSDLARRLALAAIVALVWPRCAQVRAARLGAWSRAGRAELTEAERAIRRSRIAPFAWVDGTGAAGLALFAALFAGATSLGPVAPEELLFAALPPLLLTRHRLPRTAHERLVRLRALALASSAHELQGLALQLAVHRDTEGVLQDARLRLVTASRAPGVIRLDVVATETARSTGLEPSFLGLVVTRESTPAERLVAAAFPELTVVRGPAGRVARFVDVATLVRVARVVDVEAARDVRASDAPPRARTSREAPLHA